MASSRTCLSRDMGWLENTELCGSHSLDQTVAENGAVTFSLQKLDSVGSTNEWVSAHHSTLPSNTLVYTLNQTQGKGRNGRVWASRPGDSVAFSLLVDRLPDDILPTWVPLLAGVSVVAIVTEIGVTGASLKWPNDVLVEGRKLAGILVEVLPDSRMVVGVGVNIASTLDSLPHPTATSLALQGSELTNIEQELLAPIADLLDSYVQLAKDNSAEYVHSEWQKVVTDHLSTLGRAVRWEADDGSKKRGFAKHLAGDGGLVVREVSGLEDWVIRSGDVFQIERS